MRVQKYVNTTGSNPSERCLMMIFSQKEFGQIVAECNLSEKLQELDRLAMEASSSEAAQSAPTPRYV
jgi:hypothetical protein